MANDVGKLENVMGGFSIEPYKANSFVTYPNIQNLNEKSSIEFEFLSKAVTEIEVREANPSGKLLATCKFNSNKTKAFKTKSFNIGDLQNNQTICLVFKASSLDNLIINRFRFI